MRRPRRKHPDARRAETAFARFLLAVEKGHVELHPRIQDRLHELDLAPGEVMGAVLDAAREIRISDSRPMKESWDPPGHAFVWDSARFRRKMYLKFRLEGKRPTVVLYSFHPADY